MMRDVDVTITFTNGPTFTASDIISADIKRGITDGSFGIGFTQSDRLTFQAASSEKIEKKKRCDVTVTINTDSDKAGRFYVDECTRDGSIITVTAYDLMYLQTNIPVKFTGVVKYELPALTFPCSMQAVLDYICTYRNITCSFTCQNYTVTEKPMKSETEYYTVREIIGFIAGCHGRNAKFDDDGVLQFVPFAANNDVTLTAANVIDMTIDDSEPFAVHGILFEKEDGPPIYIKDGISGADYDPEDVGVVKTFNPFATVQIAENVWTLLGGTSGLSYYGGRITRRGDTLIHCGDLLTVGNIKYPDDTDSYRLCVTDISYSFSAADGFMETISSQADKTDNYPVNGSSGGGGSGNSGVGEWLDDGHTAEIFNCYSDWQWGSRNYTNMKYDTIEGHSNSSKTDGTDFDYYGGNHIEGNDNSAYWAFYSHIGGDYNTVGVETEGESYSGKWNTACFVHGYRNTLDHENTAFAAGGDNKMTLNDYCAVFGQSNELASSDESLVFGQSNKVTSSDYTLVGGADNTVTNALACVVFGENNNIQTGQNCLFIGNDIKLFNSNYNHEKLIVGSTNMSTGKQAFSVKDQGDMTAAYGKFTVDDAGIVTATRYDTSGADYAEYFEWADGNPDNEDRCGMLVILSGDRIIPAHGDDILGAVSARASVVGNAYEEHWHSKYLTDVYGRAVYDNDGKPMLSPDYDSKRKYIPRSQRPEWDVVGLVGRLIVRDDGSCTVGGSVSARNGIGTACFKNTGMRVLRRIDNNHIEVLIR